MSQKFYTQYDRPKTVGEFNKDKYIVEIGTYQPSQKLIESFLRAGQIVKSSRELSYDYDDICEDDGRDFDITRERGVDVVDVESAARSVGSRIAAKLFEKSDTKQKTSETEKQPEKAPNVSENPAE